MKKDDDFSLPETRRSALSPVRILVVGDFAQRTMEAPLADRRPVHVDRETLPRWLASLRAEVSCEVPNVLHAGPPDTLRITLAPADVGRLTPDSIADALPIFAGVADRLRGLGGRHMIEGRLRAGAVSIGTDDAVAEVERTAALLSSQMALLFQQPAFAAIEKAWHPLDTLVRLGLAARVDAVSCTADELRGDIYKSVPALGAWIDEAVREGLPYVAVLLALDLDGLPGHPIVNRLSFLAHERLTPVLTGMSDSFALLLSAPLNVPLTQPTRVRPPYGTGDGDLHARTFPFEEPAGGPPTARWATGMWALARCLAPDSRASRQLEPGVQEARVLLAQAFAWSRAHRIAGSGA